MTFAAPCMVCYYYYYYYYYFCRLMLILLRTRYLSTHFVQATSKFSERVSKFHTIALFIITEL